MNKKVKFIIGVILIIAFSEGLYIYKILPLEKNFYPNNFSFYDDDDSYISAQGTWVASDQKWSIQSSKIICRKHGMTCTEARGQLFFGRYLNVDLIDFPISIWNEKEIVTAPASDPKCTRYIMRFDRIQKQVTAIRTTIKNTDDCSIFQKEPIHFYLGDGGSEWIKVNK